MSTEFAIAKVMTGQLNALVEKMMRQMDIRDPNEAVRRVNSDEWIVTPVLRWRVDENGWIRFILTSTGETGAEWADWFRENEYDLGNEAEFMLRSGAFRPSPKGTIYEIAVLPGKLWKDDNERITSNIRAYCDDHGLVHGKEENAEVGCLIRRAFSDEEIEAMGLTWIVTMHDPISDSDGYPFLFGALRSDGDRRFGACVGKPSRRWFADDGFAVLVSQVSPSVSES